MLTVLTPQTIKAARAHTYKSTRSPGLSKVKTVHSAEQGRLTSCCSATPPRENILLGGENKY